MPSDDRSSDEGRLSTVLVLEPDILVRMIISDYLRDCGFKVVEGVTADDAVAVLESGQKIDIIFAEVQLNGSMDGFGLVQWVREKQPDIDMILTAGIARAAERVRDLCDEGPLEKPYHPRRSSAVSTSYSNDGEQRQRLERDGQPRKHGYCRNTSCATSVLPS